ncbi:sialate O-acetylesterase [Spirosoma montaniterrae]|uniref:Sialate O-acetylesterase domain-containing protein n=1 Tax=Spirosoma montaniterrae TaxID=1178516 RepID=A0A1P9WWD2_9BACT|nr:sialate O-acetylesterase [Spirosoma montaniterrae]AQG79673.1 hypothetical protein AWR27_10235 [Spirosoma montaniterrae]
MERFYGCLILFFCYFEAVGQISFNQLPRDLQLYPRNDSGQAPVVIAGQATAPGLVRVGVQVFREGVLTATVSQTLTPTGTSQATTEKPFSLSTVIKAEPAEYEFKVWAYTTTDSTLVVQRQRVVCGDVYIIHGQSNALALPGLDDYYSWTFDDKYLRNVMYPFGASNPEAEMRWYPAKQPFASVGGLGLSLQRYILQTYGIPTVVLNGAMGGTGIAALSARNPLNPADATTIYGQLLLRAQWAGIAKHAKAIIWKQGEAEAGDKPEGYDTKFTTLYNQFRQDYGNARMYVGQINILNVPVDGAAALRDFQRRTKYLYPNVETIATVGTPGYDGVHYDPLAHQRMAYEQFRLIARDIYGSTDTEQINSPDIRKVFYNARKDSITIEYEPQMQMVWVNDTTFYNFNDGSIRAKRFLKDVFYLDGQADWVSGGMVRQNRVLLGLKQPATATKLRYLPAYFSDIRYDYYNGPTLRNTRGMRAFSFDNVPIADAIATVTTLVARPLSEKQIQLTWTASAGAQTQLLERADSTATNFRLIANLNGTANSFSDTNIPNMFGTYFYRLRSFSNVSESVYSNVVTARPLVLGIEPVAPLVRLYPNPLAPDRVLYIEADKAMFTSLVVRDLMGRAVKSWQGTAQRKLTIPLPDLEAGLYMADLQTDDGQTLHQKVLVR